MGYNGANQRGDSMSEEQVLDFGMRLRQLREDRGLSRSALAKKLGVSKETVYRYESNIQSPSLERTKHIAVILRTSIDYTLKLPGLSKEQRDTLSLFLRVFVNNKLPEK